MKTYNRGKAVKLSSYFISTEFDCKCGKCSTTYIDEKLVMYLQSIREHFGKPVTITSGYRCPTHNASAAVGGAKNSYHVRGQAADIVVSGVEPKEVAKYAESIGVKGIGVYSSFTHIDTRTTKYFWYDGGASNVSSFGGSTINPSNNTTKQELTTTNKIVISFPNLQRGNKNAFVRVAQALLGISVDGVYGKQTELAVYNFQKKKGLAADKKIGKDTWKALFK